jgi:hypothetical protein
LAARKGVGRATADDQRVAPRQQILDHGDLVTDLGSSENGDVGMRRVVSGAAQVLQFLLHEEAGDGRQETRDTRSRRVSSVRRAKGVVPVDVAQGGHLPGKVEVVLLFALAEARVFEHQDVAGLEGPGDRLDLGAGSSTAQP